jgi:hypothetical protein
MPQSYNLHGYQPRAIDERILTEEDRKEAFDEALRGVACGDGGGDWRDYATRQEFARLEREVDELHKARSPYVISNGKAFEVREKRYELANRCRLRAFARKIYSGGRPVWFGDGVPTRSTG